MFDILSSMSSLNGMKMDELFPFEKVLKKGHTISIFVCLLYAIFKIKVIADQINLGCKVLILNSNCI